MVCCTRHWGKQKLQKSCFELIRCRNLSWLNTATLRACVRVCVRQMKHFMFQLNFMLLEIRHVGMAVAIRSKQENFLLRHW